MAKTIEYFGRQYEYVRHEGVATLICMCEICKEKVHVNVTHKHDDKNYCYGCTGVIMINETDGKLYKKKIIERELPEYIDGFTRNMFINLKYNHHYWPRDNKFMEQRRRKYDEVDESEASFIGMVYF